jgi:hypothetical protein
MDCCSGLQQHSAFKQEQLEREAASDLTMNDQDTTQHRGLAQMFLQADSVIERRR